MVMSKRVKKPVAKKKANTISAQKKPYSVSPTYSQLVGMQESTKRRAGAEKYRSDISKELKSYGLKGGKISNTAIWAGPKDAIGSRQYGVAGIKENNAFVDLKKGKKAAEFARKKLVAQGKRSGAR